MKVISSNNPNSEKIPYFKELLSPVHDSVYKYIFYIVKNKVTADDIFQNTLLAAYTHIYQLRDEENLNTGYLKLPSMKYYTL